MEVVCAQLQRVSALESPTVEAIEQVFETSLTLVDRGNRYWQCFDGRPEIGPFTRVDFRVPGEGATKSHPFLVVDLRAAALHLDVLVRRYGPVTPSDVSAHHPEFIGYKMRIGDRPIRVTAAVASGAVQSLAIDFSEGVSVADS